MFDYLLLTKKNLLPPRFLNFAGGFPRCRRRRKPFELFQEYSSSFSPEDEKEQSIGNMRRSISRVIAPAISVAGCFLLLESAMPETTVQPEAFSLNFFAGGSIFGSSFEVMIDKAGHVLYRETTLGGTKEVRKFERDLTEQKFGSLRATIVEANLAALESQDFTKEPLAPDQAYYRIFLSMDRKEHSIRCSIPLSGMRPETQCQKQIENVRLQLNKILGVEIY